MNFQQWAISQIEHEWQEGRDQLWWGPSESSTAVSYFRRRCQLMHTWAHMSFSYLGLPCWLPQEVQLEWGKLAKGSGDHPQQQENVLVFSPRGDAASASSPPLVLGSHWGQGSQSKGEGSLTAEQRRITTGALRVSRPIACSGTTSRTNSAVSMPLAGYGRVWGVKRLLNLGLLKTVSHLGAWL